MRHDMHFFYHTGRYSENTHACTPTHTQLQTLQETKNNQDEQSLFEIAIARQLKKKPRTEYTHSSGFNLFRLLVYVNYYCQPFLSTPSPPFSNSQLVCSCQKRAETISSASRETNTVASQRT